MKPKSWRDIPPVVLGRWLWDSGFELYFDPYESSKAEAIRDILNGNLSSRNASILETQWNQLDLELLRVFAEQERRAAIRTAEQLQTFLETL